LLFVSTPDYAQESLGFEKICDFSPEGKFSLRSSSSGEPVDPDHIYPDLIKAAELVSTPPKIDRLQIT